MVDEDLGVEGDENGPARLVPETVLKAVLIKDGQETCHVGFLPRGSVESLHKCSSFTTTLRRASIRGRRAFGTKEWQVLF
jgi:hypothetical protein